MYDRKIFHFALLVSILIHSVIFLGIPYMKFVPSRRVLKKLEISYYKEKKMPRRRLVDRKPESILKKLPKITKEEILKTPKTSSTKTKKAKKKTMPAIKHVKEKKFEAVVKEEKDASKKATYISYYKAIREKIKEHVNRNYPKSKNLGEGEVFLSFVVASSGELLQVRVIENRSVNNTPLRSIAINSVRDANPFPEFPKGMSQYQITFNVAISFELNK